MDVKTVLADIEKKQGKQLAKLFGSIDSIKSITLLVLKRDRKIELWKRARSSASYVFVKEYGFTGYSGQEGPKLREGDGQIPEGIYGIEYLNPNSQYHLSMKISYPSAGDKNNAQKDGRTDLGSDIFIHGKERSIGCVPIGDKEIEELFYLVGHLGIENVTVIISPVDFRKGDLPSPLNAPPWLPELYDRIARQMQEYRKAR